MNQKPPFVVYLLSVIGATEKGLVFMGRRRASNNGCEARPIQNSGGGGEVGLEKKK